MMEPAATIDHLVVTAPNLKAGVQWVRDALGATPELGGKHPRMGTHNCLLRLGAKTYLEVIAVDPNAPPPGRDRWFGLDDIGRGDEPRLAAWVARCADIGKAMTLAGEALGEVEPMSRGDLSWLISLGNGGTLPMGGIAPILIQWNTAIHPASGMRDSGCSLSSLDLYHPESARISHLLQSIGFEDTRVHLHPAAPGEPPRIAATVLVQGKERVLPPS